MPRPSESAPLIGVIPPYVLDRLAQHADARVSMPAVKTPVSYTHLTLPTILLV